MKLLPLLVVFYCIWNARGLLDVWMQTYVLDQSSLLLFLIWVLPVLYYWLFVRKSNDIPQQVQASWLLLAVLASLIGNLGELSTLEYLGLAFSLAAVIPKVFMKFVWILTSFFWMPGSDWIASHVASTPSLVYVSPFKILFITFLSLYIILRLK